MDLDGGGPGGTARSGGGVTAGARRPEWTRPLRLVSGLLLAIASMAASAVGAGGQVGPIGERSEGEPLVVGETFTLPSGVLGETRRINVFRPTMWGEEVEDPLPVLYMPDGGVGEDFLHIAGLMQVSVSNGTMRPFLLVGIENTQRRRDLTGPTRSASDREIAPVVGGAAAFRRFMREELMPEIRRRYRTTEEAALVGESLAGLFVVETFFLAPDLFDTYIAVDPSLWWDEGSLVSAAEARLAGDMRAPKRLVLVASNEPLITEPTARLAAILEAHAPPQLLWAFQSMPEESHGTVYHPAALWAFRQAFAPPEAP